jgi:hypothetical protein
LSRGKACKNQKRRKPERSHSINIAGDGPHTSRGAGWHPARGLVTRAFCADWQSARRLPTVTNLPHMLVSFIAPIKYLDAQRGSICAIVKGSPSYYFPFQEVR